MPMIFGQRYILNNGHSLTETLNTKYIYKYELFDVLYNEKK